MEQPLINKYMMMTSAFPMSTEEYKYLLQQSINYIKKYDAIKASMNGNKKDSNHDLSSTSTSQSSSIPPENGVNSKEEIKEDSMQTEPKDDTEQKTEKEASQSDTENSDDKEEHMVVEVMPEACVLSDDNIGDCEKPASSKMSKTSESGLFATSSFPNVGLDLRKMESREEYTWLKNHLDSLSSLYGYINPMDLNQGKILPNITKTIQQVNCMCYKCKMQFVSVEDLAKHCQVHRVEGDKMLNRCHMCPYGTNRTYDFRRHLKTHLRQKGHRCLRCGGVFKTKKEANDHLCIQTGLSVGNTQSQNSSVADLYKKKQAVPAEQPNFDLSESMLSLINNANKNLQQYLLKFSEIKEQAAAQSRIQWNETEEKKFKCHYCSYSSSSSSNLNSHLETHVEEKPQSCSQCGKTFNNSVTLKHHMKLHSGDCPFTCGICGKSFRHSTNLNSHILRHHTKDNNCSCQQCGKSFASSSELLRHERTHSTQKPYKCPYCELSFTESGSLQNHIVCIHTQDFRHRCTICDKAFIFPAGLRRHLHTLHGEEK